MEFKDINDNHVGIETNSLSYFFLFLFVYIFLYIFAFSFSFFFFFVKVDWKPKFAILVSDRISVPSHYNIGMPNMGAGQHTECHYKVIPRINMIWYGIISLHRYNGRQTLLETIKDLLTNPRLL